MYILEHVIMKSKSSNHKTTLKLFSISIVLVLFLILGGNHVSLARNSDQLPVVELSQGSITTTRVSVASDGTQGNYDSGGSVISTDGRYVVFASASNNLASGDTNDFGDIFVHDQQTGQTSRVSIAYDETQTNAHSGDTISISDDGRYVTFGSNATNLVSNDTNGVQDIFMRDRLTNQTFRLSVASDGTQGNDKSMYASLSGNGNYLAFASEATNLTPGDTNGVQDIFVHDRLTGQTTLVSVASDGTPANSGSLFSSISADGRYVTFVSSATNLVLGDTNGKQDVFIRDRLLGQTTRVSVSSDSIEGNGDSTYSSISADGPFIVFQSFANNLVEGDTNGDQDIFLHALQTHQTTRVSIASDGTQGNNESLASSISADGRYVAFDSWADNLVDNDNHFLTDLFLHDRETGQTIRVSLANDGTEGDGSTFNWIRSISSDGQFVAYSSNSTNLVSDDTNNALDVFVAVISIPTPPSPQINLNYSTGAPGSFFTVTGQNFPETSQATVSINGTVLTTILPVDDTGSFTFSLKTTGADAGYYGLTVSVNPSASVSFTLDDESPLRPQEGDGVVLQVPAGIAFNHQTFLPVVVR